MVRSTTVTGTLLSLLIPLVTASSFVPMLGCSKDKPAPAAQPPAQPPAGSATVAPAPLVFPLATGETYFGGRVMATNLVQWKLADGTIVQLGIVRTGTTPEGRDTGVLRAFHGSDAAYDVAPAYTLDPKVEHWSEVKLLANERVMFRYGEVGAGHRARNGVLLRWDADAKRVRVAKRWSGASSEQEPAWLLTGEYAVPPESEALCLKVIARMVSCEKDAGFRDAIFRRDDPAEKAAMQTHFDTHVAKWKQPAEAKAQCQKWASAEFVDTHFSEPAKLGRLAAETGHDCVFFAAEIVDEGGLTTALTVK